MRYGACGDCDYSFLTEQLGSSQLYCREDSPKLQLLPGAQQGTMMLVGIWPPVKPEEWCGKFKAERSSGNSGQPQGVRVVGKS